MAHKFIKMASFNCNSVRNSLDIVMQLLRENDIVLLQEIMLIEDDVGILKDIDSNYDFAIVPSKLNSGDCFTGRPVGGLAVFWRRSLSLDVIPVVFNENFLIIKLMHALNVYVICNVYLPCDSYSGEVVVQYKAILADMESILRDLNVNDSILIGDFNADPFKGRFWSFLNTFVNRLNLNITDLCLPSDTFTYLSPGHNSTSWLDHVISTRCDLISNINVCHEKTCYDHFPLTMNLNLNSDIEYKTEHGPFIDIESFIDWPRMTQSDELEYQFNISERLKNVSNEALLCRDKFCKLSSHRETLDETYKYLIDILLSSSENFKITVKRRHKVIPGWNECCKSLHLNARDKFLKWKDTGKCRTGKAFEEMKESRQKFKSKLKECKRNEEFHRNNALISSFESKNKSKFWKDVRKYRGGLIFKNANKIDGNANIDSILSCFKNKYESILDNHDCQSLPDNFFDEFQSYININDRHQKVNELHVSEAIKSLNDCIDFNHIHSKHLKLAPRSFSNIIAKLFSSFICHSYLPAELLRGQLCPIVKNNLGDLCSSDNYRPVMISSNFLKVLEYCLLPHIASSVSLSTKQFGFRKHTSTLMAVTVFKETVHYYMSKKSMVYTSFLDLSKAFDRVNYFKLIAKLMQNNIPPSIVHLLYVMYCNQNVYVRFNNHNSSSWKIGNGVRQGGILSPLLFNIYINDILNNISSSKIGCKLGINTANVIAYADDICILSPSSSGLQQLLNSLYLQLNELDLKLNENKTVCMVFTPRREGLISYGPKFYINGYHLNIVDHYTYLGVVIKNTLCNSKDIERCEEVFYKQFYSFFRKFHFLDTHVLLFFFKTYCSSLYGAELWYDKFGCSQQLKHFSVGYHKAVKKVWGVSTRQSNHEICNISNLLTFEHFINLKSILFFYQLCITKSDCMMPHKHYFQKYSHILRKTEALLKTKYDVLSLLNNDIEAIESRIRFVSDREDRLR